jgi:intracellular septation protein
MKLLFDFLPALLFFATLKIFGVFEATAVAMVAGVLQIGWLYFRSKVEIIHIVTVVMIVVFGGLTLYLQDPFYFKLKPSIVYWLFATILFATQWFGEKPAIQYVMGSRLTMPDAAWRIMNLGWATFFTMIGFLNIYIAYFYGLELPEETRTEHWAAFKVFGFLPLTLAFAIVQMLFLSKYIDLEKVGENPRADIGE